MARCELGLRMSDVARELRISADYLKLLEAGDFDQLPAPTYVSGFLKGKSGFNYDVFLDLSGKTLTVNKKDRKTGIAGSYSKDCY